MSDTAKRSQRDTVRFLTATFATLEQVFANVARSYKEFNKAMRDLDVAIRKHEPPKVIVT